MIAVNGLADYTRVQLTEFCSTLASQAFEARARVATEAETIADFLWRKLVQYLVDDLRTIFLGIHTVSLKGRKIRPPGCTDHILL